MVKRRVPEEERGRNDAESALSGRYDELVGRIRGFLRVRFDRLLDRHELDDIAHGAAESTALQLGEICDCDRFLSYAQATARNLARSQLRKRAHRPVPLSLESIDHELRDPRCDRLAAQLRAQEEIQELDAMVDNESQDMIVAWLGCLSERPEPSRKEIARRLGWSVAKLERKIQNLRTLSELWLSGGSR